ncbi:hypothetical protein [Corallibacter sp.]|uniref:hypothetical protein n=1 Tax=Corallibacter sp. TaxID=2038084 RepID=UPI003AB3845A
MMIVNPQFFNYRLIIGTLVIAFVVLGSYSFSSYNTLKDHEVFLEQERRFVQKELSEMIALYDKVTVKNEMLSEELQQSKSKIQAVLDSLIAAKTSVPLISKISRKLSTLKQENALLLSKIQEANHQNKVLSDQVLAVSEKLALQQAYISSLESKNEKLSKTLLEAQNLAVLQIQAKALHTVSSKSVSETEKANKADHIEVCFTLLKNNLTPQGGKDIYIQIIDPNNNVVANRGVVNFGEKSLIYTGKTEINYTNTDLETCTKMNVVIDNNLIKGNYLVNVFHDQNKLGSTKIALN